MTQNGNESIIDKVGKKSFSILYVEDEADIRNMLASILARKYPQIRIDLAENGRAGLEMFKTYYPDMVITDNVMPIMTGVEMVAEIKSLRPQTFILFLTANPDQSFLSLLHAKESIQYLPKPAKIEKIFSLVDGYIGNCQ